jgi:RNA polymerase sigma factor (sigma-70 family)
MTLPQPGKPPNNIDALSRRFRPALIAFFMRRHPDAADAEDMTQDVFSRLASMQITEFESAEAYIFTVAGNLLRDRDRRQKVRERHAGDAPDMDESFVNELDPERVTSARQQLDVLLDALKQLPQTTRTIFVLYRLEGVDRRDLANAYNISLSTVDRHLRTALMHLTVRLRVTE